MPDLRPEPAPCAYRAPDCSDPKVRIRAPASLGRGLWTLLGGVARTNGTALPPTLFCVHGFPLVAGQTPPCGCTEEASNA